MNGHNERTTVTNTRTTYPWSEMIIPAMFIVFTMITSIVILLFEADDLAKKVSDLEKRIEFLEDENIALTDKVIDLTSMASEPETVSESENIIQEDTSVAPATDVVDSDVLSTVEIDKAVFRDTISTIAPNLVGIEDAIFYNYETYGISPAFQLAVFCLESGYGTSKLAIEKNNLCGFKAYPTATLTSYENATHFETKSDCVLRFGETIYNNYILQELTTLSTISKKYCPPKSEHWENSVSSLKTKITNTYEELYSQV